MKKMFGHLNGFSGSAAIIIFQMALSSACSGQETKSYEDFFDKYSGSLSIAFRLPRDADLSYWGTDVNTVFYKSVDDERHQKAPYWTKGDFNADGVTDRSYLLFNNMDSSVALYAFISQEGGSYEVRLVEPDADRGMGVSTHRLASGELVINLFRFEGHGVGSYLWRNDLTDFEFKEDVWPPYE